MRQSEQQDSEKVAGADSLETMLGRHYEPPALFITEEVELGGGYHVLWVNQGAAEESDWSEPYKKSGIAQYRVRVVRVPYPPSRDVCGGCGACLLPEEPVELCESCFTEAGHLGIDPTASELHAARQQYRNDSSTRSKP